MSTGEARPATGGPEAYEGIVVLGAPRSGTTLVRRLLDAHPAIVCPPETNLLSASSRFLDEQTSALGLRIGVVPGLSFAGFEEAEVLARLRALVFSFYRDLARRAGKPRWAEKTAFDIFHLDGIERLLGDSCRYVCVTRHGLDATCSMKELSDAMDLYLPELHDYVRRQASPLQAMAHAWADANRRLLTFMTAHQGECVALRYEDLIANPAAELTRVFDFLGEPVDVPRLLAAAFSGRTGVGLGDWKTYETSGLDRGSIGRGRDLPEDVRARLAPVLNPVLEDLGYERVSTGPAPLPDESQRRYRAMKMVQQMRSSRTAEAAGD